MLSADGWTDAAQALRSAYESDGQSGCVPAPGSSQRRRRAREFEEMCEKLTTLAPYLVLRR
jgi:salicylate synthetase